MDWSVPQWEQFVEEHYDRIFRFALHLLGNRSEAEEVAQDTFLKAYYSKETLLNPDSRVHWIYQIARNVAVDRRRWWKRRAGVEQQGEEEGAHVTATELQITLRELVLALPLRQREVFLLRHLAGFSTEETARLLGIREGSVKTHLMRAVSNLKEKLES
jgi:RNA polymerase sigma-70 factor (ECF subfamily)